MTLHKQKLPLIFDCKTKVEFSGEDLQAAILRFVNGKPVQQTKVIFLHGNYPAVSVGGRKLHVHRLLGEYYFGELLPAKCIHHVNGKRHDARRENLEVIKNSLHASLHNRGKKLTLEHRGKIANANKRRKGISVKKRVHIPLWLLKQKLHSGDSINSIARHFGCDWSTVKSRIHENPELLEAK